MKKRVREQFVKSETYFLTAIFVGLVYMLFVQTAGIADNGDFQRSLSPNFMYYLDNLTYEQLYFDFVNTKYKIESPIPIILPVYMNTHAVVVWLAKLLNVIFYSRTIFELRFLSLVYIAVFLYGLYLIFRAVKTKSVWLNLIIFTCITLVLCDRGNTLYFGSLYAEPVAFVGFVVGVGVLLDILKFKKLTKYNVIAFFVAMMMFMGAKVQYGLLSVLFIPFAVLLCNMADTIAMKKLIKLMTVIMIFVSMGVYFIQPPYLDEVTTFDSVFCGVLTGDEIQDKEALAELGLSEEYYVLAGMDGFESEYPIDVTSDEFHEGFYEKIGKADLVVYYLKNFDRLWAHLENTAEVSFMNLPEYLGNRTAEFSAERVSYDGFDLYDSFKKAVVPKNLIFVLGFFVLYFAAELYIAIKTKKSSRRLWSVFVMTLIVFCGIQFVLPTVGNGGIDIAKQLYMFNVVFDMLVLALVYYIIGLAESILTQKRKVRG